MATVKRSLAEKPRRAEKPAAPDNGEFILPTEPTVVSTSLDDYHLLIHGEKKIGKTTLATVVPGVLNLTFDPIRKSLAIVQIHVPNWKDFMSGLRQLEEMADSGKFPYSRVVLDGADIWYRHCQTWVEKKLVVDHVSEEKWGRGWDMLKFTFADAVTRLMALPCGVWFICHSSWQEKETRVKGVKIDKLLPSMKGGGEEILNGRVDAWFAYDYIGPEHAMIVRGDERTGAGCGIRGHFLTPDGRQIHEVPMGDSEEEAYGNLQAAFANKQTYVTLAERDEKKGGPKKEIKKPKHWH